ncbi:hypothetical protein BDW62DRAFT_155791 [Aspergillus aurantiobrunneus]
MLGTNTSATTKHRRNECGLQRSSCRKEAQMNKGNIPEVRADRMLFIIWSKSWQIRMSTRHFRRLQPCRHFLVAKIPPNGHLVVITIMAVFPGRVFSEVTWQAISGIERTLPSLSVKLVLTVQ